MSAFFKSLITPRRPNPEAGKRLLAFLVGCVCTVFFCFAMFGVNDLTMDTERVVRLIEANAPEKIDPDVLRDKVLKGIASQQDRYAEHYSATEFQEFLRDQDSEFAGIGVTTLDNATGLVVSEVYAGSGAEAAGLRRGDILLRADKLDLARQDIGIDIKIAAIRGEPGTRVALAVRRADQVFERQVTRKTMMVPSVRSDVFTLRGQRVGFFVIDQFRNHADEELAQQLAAHLDRLDAVVLDVTGNPGGSLEAASYMASLFLASDKTLYWLVDRDHPDGVPVRRDFDKAQFWRDELTPAQLRKLETLPMIVMANNGSASASEVLAGALQDNGRAKVFGIQTYGKGSVQTLFDLPNGEGIKLTTARYLTPNRHKVEGVGIKPDYYPARRARQSAFPDFENGTFPKDELNPNWLLQATAKLLDNSPALASR